MKTKKLIRNVAMLCVFSIGISVAYPYLALVQKANPPVSRVSMMRIGGPPNSLDDLLIHKLVVVGRVERVLREAHSPYTNPGPEQHTVFEFKIEKVIKDELGIKSSSIQVRQNMGDLPWALNGQIGVGRRIEGEAMLRPNHRYLLFLRQLGDRRLSEHLYAEHNGYKGISGNAGEFLISLGEFGQFEFLDGKVRWPKPDDEIGREDYLFPEGPQILGLSEQEALKLILATNKAREERIKKRRGG